MVVRSWTDGRFALVQAVGDLDLAAVPRLREELDRVLAPMRGPQLAIDLTEVPFCDSVGLGLLVSTLTRIKDLHGRLILVVGPGMIHHLLAITNLDRHFELSDSVDGARQALAA
ncbi:STAS domain-containing protein [Nonomuraea africana]|uniref:Anti-sigma factor antagonist n=1 Tax=Nonomuraea africana TaxID=46171 RepID=A0ABR9KUJ4_9ACTN|nr:STAS domain-containing protein [Nonomuraea africana]MBE1565702.1 anti-anti-sigma factor [Nonomuraea africana]